MAMEVWIKLKELNEFLTCGLCNGYLIDATAISECLHSFCRSCIVQYLKQEKNCPSCKQLIHQSYPLNFIRNDRTKQDIVYKLVPGLRKRESEREMEFFKKSGVCEAKVPKLETESIDNEEESSEAGKDSPENKEAQDLHRYDEQIALCLEYDKVKDPTNQLKPLRKKFIKCSGFATIGHVKKFISKKLKLESYNKIDVLCNEEILGKDHTLKFLSVTRWKLKSKPLLLYYRPRLELF